MKITILAFNYGYAGRVVNGPGMCLTNLVNFIRSADIEVDIFTVLNTDKRWPCVKNIKNHKAVSKSVLTSDIVHVWSGMTPDIIKIVRFANNLHKKVIIGPNVLDTVKFPEEQRFLNKVNFDLLLTVNQHLRFRIHKHHNIPLNKIKEFLVGPDPEMWKPLKERDGTILWKGNGRQFVKDVEFARELEKKLGDKYAFKFLGDPSPYDYYSHIDAARSSSLTIITSLSETMGLAMMESWSAGIPSISHPKIHMHGVNYQTGIITSKTIEDYVRAIDEVMENKALLNSMSKGARQYILDEFSSEAVAQKYINIIDKVGE